MLYTPPDAQLIRALSVLVLGDVASLTSGALYAESRSGSPFDAVVVLDAASHDVFVSIYEAPGMAVAA